jgi:transposase
MLDQGLRTAILSLRTKGHGIRQIARALQISRGTVRTVLKAGSPTVPRMARAEKAEPFRDQILEWVDRCRGNLVRVHEELVAQGVAMSYPALTAFCRRHGIGHEPPAAARCQRRRTPAAERIAYGQKMHDFFQSLLSRGRVAPPSSGGPALGRSSLMERGIAGIVFGGWTTPGACASPAS